MRAIEGVGTTQWALSHSDNYLVFYMIFSNVVYLLADLQVSLGSYVTMSSGHSLREPMQILVRNGSQLFLVFSIFTCTSSTIFNKEPNVYLLFHLYLFRTICNFLQLLLHLFSSFILVHLDLLISFKVSMLCAFLQVPVSVLKIEVDLF